MSHQIAHKIWTINPKDMQIDESEERRRKMKKKVLSVVMAGIMILGLGACGSSSSSASVAASAPATSAATSETASAASGADTSSAAATASSSNSIPAVDPNTNGAEEITLWHYFDSSADAKAIVDKCNEYNKLQSKVHITPTYVSRTELMNQYTIGAVSGELPDIGMVDSPDMESYISLGVFEDVTDELGSWDELSKFYAGPLSSCKDAAGKLYGLPQNSNCLCLAVNMDLLNKAGITDVPKSMDDFKKAVEAATDSSNSVFGYAMCAISTEEGTFQLLPWIVATHDGTKSSLSDLTNANCDLGLDMLGGFVKNGNMSSECVNWTQADAYNQFCAGKAALAEVGTWHMATMAKDVNGSFKYKICLLPTGDAGTSSSTIGGENFGICTGCKDKAACVDFLKWFMSADQEAKWAVLAGKLPVRSDAKPVYTYEQDAFATFQDEMNYALARGPHAQWPTISEQLYTAAQKVFLQGTSASDALASAWTVIGPILQENPLPKQ